MHTVHFDPAIERQLDRLANETGRQVDQIIEQAVLDFLSGLSLDRTAKSDIQSQAWCDSLRAWVESQPMQVESAGAFTRRMREQDRY